MTEIHGESDFDIGALVVISAWKTTDRGFHCTILENNVLLNGAYHLKATDKTVQVSCKTPMFVIGFCTNLHLEEQLICLFNEQYVMVPRKYVISTNSVEYKFECTDLDAQF